MFHGKTLLITGGTGTFGNAVLNRILREDVGEVRIFSRDEKKQEDMRIAFADSRIKFYVGDVRDAASVQAALKGVDYVFHAAALKQVPSCEFFPLEAVKTNTLGAGNVLDASSYQGVNRVVVLSTDKAVYPINAMGMSKALMEKLMVSKARSCGPGDPVFCGTRYGNVMMSRGSVISHFVRLIREGKPLPVTDPTMTRYMMSIDDAVDLVFHAFSGGVPGAIYVLKSPAATVEDLAETLKDIFNSGVSLQVIGTRHGEKKHETLVTREEMVRAVDEGKYYSILMDSRNLNYGAYLSEGNQSVSDLQDFTSENTRRLTRPELKELLLGLPEIQKELTS